MPQETVELPSWAFQVGLWAAGAGAVLAAAIRLIPKVRELYMGLRSAIKSVDDEARAREELKVSLANIRRVAVIDSLCRQWVHQKGAQRASLIIANNGGEAWKGTGPLYINNPCQVVGPGNRDTRDQWQEWEADAWYITFLGKLLESFEHRRCYLLVTDTDVDGELKLDYEDQGTAASVVLPFVWKAGSQLWYVSLNFGRGLRDGESSLPDDERQTYVTMARELYNNPGRCRALVDSARSVYYSVR